MADTIGTAYVQIEPSFEGGVSKIEKQFGGAGTSSGNAFSAGFGKAMKGAAAVTAVTGAAITALGTKFVDSASSVAEYGDNIDKMSQKMGLTAESYQEWDAVMQHSGTSMETMKASMKTLANAAETNNKAFKELGITENDLKTMNQQELFEATIAGLQNVEDTTQRTYLAGKLLGRGATELGALLNTSAEDTQAMRDRVRELGGVMSEDAVKASAAFQDQLQDMQTAFSGISRGLMAEFLPSMTQVMSGLTEIFSGNTTEGLEQISEGITNIVDGITQALPQIASTGTQIIMAIADAIIQNLPQLIQVGFQILNQLVDYILQNLPMLVEMGVQIIVELAQGISEALPQLIPTIVDVVMQIIDILIQNAPLLLEAGIQLITGLAEGFINAIPVLIQYIPQIIQSLVDALITGLPMLIQGAIQLVTGIADAMPEIIQAIIAALPLAIQAIADALPELVPALIVGAIQLVTALAAAMPEIIVALIEALPQIIDAIIQGFAALGPALLQTFQQAVAQAIPAFNQLGVVAQQAWNKIKAAFANVAPYFKTQFTNALNGIKSVWNTITTFFQGIKQKIISVFSDMAGKFTSIGRNIVNGLKKGISDAWESLKSWFQEKISGLLDAAKEALKIESPSKAFANEVGKWIPAGIGAGIEKGMGKLKDKTAMMCDEVLGTATLNTQIGSTFTASLVPNTRESSPVVITNNIKVDGAEDPEAWTQTFIRTLKREARMA